MKTFLTAIATLVIGSLPLAAAPQANIALHKKVVLETPPNYPFSSDANDALDLTDGRYSSEGNVQRVQDTEAIWVQKGTVGWAAVQPVIFTIDLESVQPISGFSYSTAAGRAGVSWPTAIYVAVSDDGKTWHYAGDLTKLNTAKVPSTESYSTFRFTASNLRLKGRYVAFGVIAMPYCFVDEVEIYRGDESASLDTKKYPLIPTMRQFVGDAVTTDLARSRMQADLKAIRAQLAAKPVPAAQQKAFSAKLQVLSAKIARQPYFTSPIKTILPLNDLHREILATHGAILAAQKTAPLSVWKQHRYAWLPFISRPPVQAKPQLAIAMLKNQFRSDALLLTNATAKPVTVRLLLQNSPGGSGGKWLKLSRAVWTDTTQNVPVADALLPLAAKEGTYSVEIPAGTTLKLFATVDSSLLSAGKHQSTLRITSGAFSQQVPFNITVSPLAMQRPRFSLGMWDYTNGNGAYGITPANRAAAIKTMREYYVNAPWGNNLVLPNPAATDFDVAGNLLRPLDFTSLKQWIALWPGAKRYCVFLAAQNSFAGAAMGSPEFNSRVGSWAKAIAAQLQQLNVRPEQLVILLVDEPQTDEQDAVIAAWAKAINAVTPKLTLFQDPSWVRPDQTKIQEAITEIDILCPDLSVYRKAGEPVSRYYEKLRRQGKELWFYQCSGPVRLYDPQLYYRYQPWHAFAVGATGQGFWSFGDTGGAPTSWHDYSISRPSSFTPAFIDTNTVYSSVHLEALREGVEDYEELAMLGDFIKQTGDDALRKQAESLRDTALNTITALWEPAYKWQAAPSSELADIQLNKIRLFLEKAGSAQ